MKTKTQTTSGSRGELNRKMTECTAEESPRSLEQELFMVLDKKVHHAPSIPNLDLDHARGKRVRFTDQITVNNIMTCHEYTKDEIKHCWWTYDERKRLLKKYHKTVDRLEDGKKEKKSSPYRGLEKVAVAGYRQSMLARNRYVDSVMDEQDKQWQAGMQWLDWDRIADLVKDDCSESSEEALALGQCDERQAQETVTTETSTDGSDKLRRCRSSLPLIRQCSSSSKKKNKKTKKKSVRRERGDPPGKRLASIELHVAPIPSVA